MEGLLDEQRNLVDQWETDYIKLERKLKLQPWVYGISAVSYTVSGILIGNGLTFSEQKPQLSNSGWVGVSIFGVTTLVYIAGHYWLQWW